MPSTGMICKIFNRWGAEWSEGTWSQGWDRVLQARVPSSCWIRDAGSIAARYSWDVGHSLCTNNSKYFSTRTAVLIETAEDHSCLWELIRVSWVKPSQLSFSWWRSLLHCARLALCQPLPMTVPWPLVWSSWTTSYVSIRPQGTHTSLQCQKGVQQAFQVSPCCQLPPVLFCLLRWVKDTAVNLCLKHFLLLDTSCRYHPQPLIGVLLELPSVWWSGRKAKVF